MNTTMNTTMNRRSFFKGAFFLATTAATAIVVTALAPAQAAYAVVDAATGPKKPTGQQEPTPSRSKPLPMCASRRQIHEADLQTVLNWWGQYGSGVQAWRYRGVPRAAVREWLFYRWEIVAKEHIYG